MSPYLDIDEAKHPNDSNAWLHQCSGLKGSVLLFGGWCKWCGERHEKVSNDKNSPRSK